jgi:transcriptional regulator with XRE-family HTH domain
MEGLMAGFGKRLEDVREARGLSRAELAKLVNVTPPAVYNWEQNDKLPRRKGLTDLCRVLGVAEDYLVRGKGVAGAVAPTVAATRSVEQILDDAKRELARALTMPADRIQLLLQVGA